MKISQENKLIVFENKQIRRSWHNQEWWFSVVDVVEVLTDSANPRDYWYKMKIRVKSEDGVELSTICRQFKLKAPDGKLRETDCATLKQYSASSNPFHLPKPSLLKDGLPKLVMKECRK